MQKKSIPNIPIAWQHPFVDVFKRFNVFESSKACKKGNVLDIQNNTIGRRVLKIEGTISASNYINIPDFSTGIKSLSLTGRYVYLEFLPVNGKFFSIHLDFNVKTRENIIRFTISNMNGEYKNINNSVLLIPFQKKVDQKWIILVLDVQYHMEHFQLFQHEKISNFVGLHSLKSIQICSNLQFRGLYTSDFKYNQNTIPKELDFKPPTKGNKWLDEYQINYFPFVEKTEQNEEVEKITTIENKENQIQNNKSQLQNIEKTQKKNNDINSDQNLLKLSNIIGYSGNICTDIKWSKSEHNLDEITYVSGYLIVISDTNKQKQRFLIGHTNQIISLEISKNGKLLISAQEGKKSLVKIWDYQTGNVLCTFSIPQYNQIKCISISHNNKYLSTCGLDEYNKDLILIFSLNDFSKQPSLISKHSSEFNIISLKYSPVESDKILTCGKENIRFYRTKNSQLAGSPVILNSTHRNTIFTVLDFEFVFDEPQLLKIKRVFVGCKQGNLFQINYNTKELEAIYKCHENAITSICLSAGFCATGGEDRYLRVWPLDFSEYQIEAKHEGIIISIAISLDSLKICAGISNGGMGILDLSNNNYKTHLRSHSDFIKEIHFHTFNRYLASLSNDFSIRFWNIKTNEQIYEFSYPQDEMCTSIACSGTQNIFIGGFSSGIFRIFDIENINVKQECRFFEKNITHVNFSFDSKLFIVADCNSFYCLFDAFSENCRPIKTFFNEDNTVSHQHSTFSSNNLLFAIILSSQVCIYSMQNYEQTFKISTIQNPVKMHFTYDQQSVVILQQNSKIKQISILNGKSIIKELLAQNSTNFSITNNNKYLFTIGTDNLIKVWDFQQKAPVLLCAYQFHSNPINSILFNEETAQVITAGGLEGIYQWQFFGNMSQQQQEVEQINNEESYISENGDIPQVYIENKEGIDQNSLQYYQIPYKNIYSNSYSDQEQPLKCTQCKTSDLNFQFSTTYIPNSPQNMCWNQTRGFYTYSVQNYLIIEHLKEPNKQDFICLSACISCIQISRDGSYIFVGASHKDARNTAWIYIIECVEFKLIKQLGFHQEGVESIDVYEKYLVSIGSETECTIGIWVWDLNKLITTSYCLQKINQVKINQFHTDNLHFTTIGGGFIKLWILNGDESLSYCDLNVDIHQNYTQFQYICQGQFALCGDSLGNILFISVQNIEIVSNFRLSSSQISQIQYIEEENLIVISSYDNKLYSQYIDSEFIAQKENFQLIEFFSSPISISFIKNEGLVQLQNRGIIYVNLENNSVNNVQMHLDNSKNRIFLLSNKIIATCNQQGLVQFWNISGGQMVGEYVLQGQLQCVYYDENEKCVFLFENENIYTVNIDNLNEICCFQLQNKDHNQALYCFSIQQSKYLLMENGKIYIFEKYGKQIQCKYFLQIQSGIFAIKYNDYLICSNNSGTIQTIDMLNQKIIDIFEIMENPHGQNIDNCQEQINLTHILYKDNITYTEIAVQEGKQSTYFAINTSLQYIFVRDFVKNELLQRLIINEFALNIQIYQNNLILVLDKGNVLKFDIDFNKNKDCIKLPFSSKITDIICLKKCLILNQKEGIQIIYE